jgi:hypothetical protein
LYLRHFIIDTTLACTVSLQFIETQQFKRDKLGGEQVIFSAYP